MSGKALRKFLRARDVDAEGVGDGAPLLELALASAHLPTVVWQKTKAADGRYYWFNAETKATSWTKPEELAAPTAAPVRKSLGRVGRQMSDMI